jgi:hypothetical protein
VNWKKGERDRQIQREEKKKTVWFESKKGKRLRETKELVFRGRRGIF